MATTLIQNGATTGAMAALMAGSGSPNSFTPGDYATKASIAGAIAAEVLTENALLTVPMADADNAQIGQLLQSVTQGVLLARGNLNSTTAADYLGVAKVICAAAKQAVAQLV